MDAIFDVILKFLSGFGNAVPGAIGQGFIWGVMAIGVFITFRILDFADLTVDGTLALGGAVCVMLIKAGVHPAIAMLLALLSGVIAGFVTGILHTQAGIPAILSGILTQLVLYSVFLRVTDKAANAPISAEKVLLSSRYVKEFSFRNPMLILVLVLLIVILLLYWFFGTELGCSLRATGTNRNMARAQGINTNMNLVLGLMFSNGLVAFSGSLLAQYQGFADVNMGRGAIVIGLAAVIIGEVLFDKIFRNFALKLLGVVLGAVIYYLVIQFVLQLGLNTNDLKMLTAAVVALFLAIPYLKKRFVRSKVKGGAAHA